MKTKTAAKKLQSMGTGDDTILAHINPEEAAVLKAGGGSGKRNPRTGLLSFGYGSDLSDPGGRNEGAGGSNFGGGGSGEGKPGESAMAQAEAQRTDMTPAAYAGLQQSMLEAIGKQDSGMMTSILGGILGPLGMLGGKLGLGDKLSQAWNERSIMNTPYGGTGGGFFSGNFGAQREGPQNGFSGPPDYLSNTPPGLLNPVAPAPVLPAPTGSPFTPRPFTPKFGKPRGLLSTNMRGFLGG